MRKSILTIITYLVIIQTSKAQCPNVSFTLPDSICSNLPFLITNTSGAGLTFNWDLNNGDLSNIPAGTNLGNPGLSFPNQIRPVIDNGNRYLFICNYLGNSILRLDFGNSYSNTPTQFNYGSFSGLLNQPIGVDVIKENGVWYAIVACNGNSKLARLSLGSDISANISNSTDLGLFGFTNPRNVKIANDGSNYFAFVTNELGNNIIRIDFGNSITNAPTGSTTLTNSSFNSIWGFDIAYDCNLSKYIGFAASYTTSRLFTLDFGASITNAPVIVGDVVCEANPSSIQLIKDGMNWHLLLASFGSWKIQNFKLGSNLINSPVSIYASIVGNTKSPNSIGVINDSSVYYAFIPNTSPATLSRVIWTETFLNFPATSNDPVSITATSSGSGYQTISLTATSASGLTNTYVDSIHINPTPSSSFSTGLACEGFPVQFNDESAITGGTITSWEWDFGDGSSLSTLQNPSHSYSTTGNFTVTLTTGSNSGCENIFSSIITINPNPVADFSFLNNQCQNTEVMFSDLSQSSGGTSIVEWIWDFGDGSPVSTDQNPEHIFSNSGTYTIQLNIETDAGCTDSLFQDITIIPSPVSAFSVTSTCIGDSVIFTNLTSIQGGGSLVYNWDFGDSNNSNQISPSHQYPLQTGNYDVTLIATAVNGCTDSIIENIRISNQPIPQFSWSPVIVCQGNAVFFSNTSIGTGGDTISAYFWDFGGQGTSSIENPAFAFPDTGYYDVTLVAVSPTYCDSSIVQQVYVIPSPIASFTASTVCLNGTTSFNPLISTPPGTVIDSVVWDFGDGTILNTLTSPTHIYTSPGTFGVTITVYNDLLCTGLYTDSVVVYPLPIADFNVPQICTDSPTEFNGMLSTVYNDVINGWLWDFAGLGTSSDSIAQFVFQSPGTYNVTLIASTLHGCTDTITKSVIAIQSPDFTFIFNEPCLGSSSGFTYISNIIPAPPSNLLWDFGDGTLSSQLNPSHLYTTAGTFTVSLFVLNPNTGCSATQLNQISVKPVPEPGFMVNDNCEDQLFQFTDTSVVQTGSIVSWNWEFGILGTSSTQNPTITPTTAGDYPVTLTVTTNVGCSASVNKTFTVFAKPEANFSPDPFYGSPPLPVTFINATSGGAIFTWYFGDGTTGSGQSPTHIYPDTGIYMVTMIALSDEGCRDTAFNTLTVLIPYLDIAVTNIYTTIENNKLKLSARLANQGNIAITEFIIKGTIENGSSISEKWEGFLAPSEGFIYEFVASYEISDSYALGFFCIEAIDPNNMLDQNLSNNKKCTAIENEFEIFAVFPNPFNYELNINFNLNTEGPYHINIYDEIGKLVLKSDNLTGLKGFNSKTINTNSLAIGNYTLLLRFRDESRYYKAIKINNK